VGTRRRVFRFTVASLALSVLATVAVAQTYPDRSIRLVVPENPGNANDIGARILASSMSTYLDKSVIVENRPGGATLVGTRAVLEARPDGYTILATGSTPLIISALLNKNITYDLTKDVTPIVSIAHTSWVLVVGKNLPVKSVRELVAYAKANPNKLNIGFTQGSGPQLVAESFKAATGIDVIGVPYQGGARVVTDLLGGVVNLSFNAPATTLPAIQSGGLRALAVTGASRDPLLPEVPTMTEEGFPSLTLTSTLGLLGPANMPSDIVRKIYDAVAESARSPDVQASLRKVGYTPGVESSREFAKLLAQYQRTWLPLARSAGFAIR
jgi:tripartite-type tricarboxylate transporter receptor subunit TctC